MTIISDDSRTNATGISKAEWLAVGLIVIGALLLRLLYVNQPMRNDESYSFLYFVLPSLRTAVSDYSVPNNHILHTVLVWISTRLFGASPQAIRLPAIVSGVLLVPTIWIACRALAGRTAALFAVAAAAALPALILYSTNSRGYMLICLATMLLVLIGDRLLDQESPALWLAMIVIGALGMWVAPVMLYPLGAVSLWLLAEHARSGGVRSAVRFAPRIGTVAAAVLALTLALYFPVIRHDGVGALTQNRFVKAESWPEMASQVGVLAHELRELLALGLSRPGLMLAALVAVIGIVAPGPKRDRRAVLVLAVICWTVTLILITRRPPPPRVLLFLAPLWCVYFGAGVSWILASLGAIRLPVHAVAATALCALAGVQVVRSRAVLISEETDWIGLRDARAIAALVASSADDRVIVNRSTSPPLDYYLFYLTGHRLADFASAQRKGRVLLVLDDRHGQTLQRVIPKHREVSWADLGPPALLEQFAGASVYAFSPNGAGTSGSPAHGDELRPTAAPRLTLTIPPVRPRPSGLQPTSPRTGR